MSSVTHLTQHLLKLDPGKNVARQALHNYLKIFVEANAPLTADVINEFLRYVLNYGYWQSNVKNLGESVASDLAHFQTDHRLDFNLNDILFPHRHQMVVMEQNNDIEELIQSTENRGAVVDERRKLIAVSENQWLAAALQPSGYLRVRVYGRVAFIVRGGLALIRPISELHYTPELELETHRWQIVEGPMMTAARFKLSEDGCQGVMVRGHMLQRYETLNSPSISQHPEVFYSLKRIERHFINPATDPYHRELVQALERSKALLRQGHPEARRIASGCLQKAKSALNNIFPNDKTLTVLVTNLEFALLPQSQSEPWQKLDHP